LLKNRALLEILCNTRHEPEKAPRISVLRSSRLILENHLCQPACGRKDTGTAYVIPALPKM
jgi:hypothetical protein